MKKILIDTNILIDYSKGHHVGLQYLLDQKKRSRAQLFVNSIIITEFLTDLNLIGQEFLYQKTLKFIDFFDNLEITKLIAFKSAELLREKQIFSVIDSTIAATCLIHDLQLFTRNRKHFAKIKGLRFFKI